MPVEPVRKRFWVIAYDVANDRRRRRVSRTLEGEAVRIQKSVFWTECSQEKLLALLRRARKELEAADKLSAYPVLQRSGMTVPWSWASTRPRLPAFWIV